MDRTQNSANSTKNIHDACKMDWAFVQSGAKVQSGCREIPWDQCQRLQCHIALVTRGCPAQGRAVPQQEARQGWAPGPGLAPGGGSTVQDGAVNGQLCRPAPHPPIPASASPHLFYKQAFQENSALQVVVPSDMLSELCPPGWLGRAKPQVCYKSFTTELLLCKYQQSHCPPIILQLLFLKCIKWTIANANVSED